MIISCPHCQTKYQVTYDAIGSAGRKVQCAHCQRDWQQAALGPEPPQDRPGEGDSLFAELDEDLLDEALAAEAKAVVPRPASPPATDIERAPPKEMPVAAAKDLPQGIDAAEMHKRQQAFSRRQNEMVARLPLARLRRSARVVSSVLLAVILSAGYLARIPIVERYPALAGLYQAIGLGVNVVGLEFSNVHSTVNPSGGRTVLTVSAQIAGLGAKPRPVPAIVVSLLDKAGRPVYEWSVRTRVPDLMAGERATFDTRLADPPEDAVRVRLSFAGAATGANEPAASDLDPQEASPAPSGVMPVSNGAQDVHHTTEPAPAAEHH